MKKILIAVAALVVVLLVAVYVVLFTSPGNKMVAGIIEDKAKTAGLDLNVSKFVLRFSSLDIEASVANMLNAKVEGNLSLFKLGFDIAYALSVDKDYVKSLNLNLAENVNFGGKVAGVASDFKANGQGRLFGSDIVLDARIKDYSPLELKLEANGIKIEELLDLVSTPRYALGVLNINANINAKDLKPDGTASVNLVTKSINYKLLQKDMNLTLPAKSEPTANIVANVSGDKVSARSDVSNDFIVFKTENTEYDLTKGVLNSDFSVDVPSLVKLKSLAGVDLKGKLNLDGNVSVAGTALDELNAVLTGSRVSAMSLPSTNLTLTAKAKGEGADKINFNALLNSTLLKITQLEGFYKLSNSELSVQTKASVEDLSRFSSMAGMAIKGSATASVNAHIIGSAIQKLAANADIAGGKINASSDGKVLDFSVNNLDVAKALVLAAQPAYASGAINAKAHLNSLDFANLNGTYEASASGVLNQTTLSKLLEKKFPANSKYSFNLNGDLKNSVANFTANAKTDFVNLSSLKGSFDIKQTKMNSNFVIDVSDFSKLNWLAERKLSGKAQFKGTAGLDKGLNATITSDDLFQGKLNATLANNVLNATLNSVDFSTLMKSVDLPDYYDVKASVKANYNLTTSSGQVDANLANGKLKNVGVIKTLATLTKSDFSKDSFTDGNLLAKLSANAVNLDLNLKSPRVVIGVAKGLVNTEKSTLNIPFSLGVDKATFKGTVGGTTSDPKVSLDAGSIAKAAVDKALSNEKVQEQTKKLEEKGKQELNKLLDKLF